MSSAQIQAHHALAAQQAEMAKRRARKPTDQALPDGIDDIMVDGQLAHTYRALRQLERELDATMMRKRTDILDAVNRNVKRSKTFRIWISNTVENQAWQERPVDENAFDFSSNNQDPTYRVQIEGKLLDEKDDVLDDDEDDGPDRDDDRDAPPDGGDAMDHDGAEETKAATATVPTAPISALAGTRKRFSHFFKAITIEFDRGRPSDGAGSADTGGGGGAARPIIEWTKPVVPPHTPNPSTASDFDAIYFERTSDENVDIRIKLVRDETPERFRLSDALAQVLDLDESDKTGVIVGLWYYVQAMGLQEEEERRMVRCDERLQQLFHREHFLFPHVTELILPHLLPLPPIVLTYTIRLDQAYHQPAAVAVAAAAAPDSTATATDAASPGSTAAATATGAHDPLAKYTIYDITVPLSAPTTAETTPPGPHGAHHPFNHHHDPLRARMTALLTNPHTAEASRRIAGADDHLGLLMHAATRSTARHTFFTDLARDPVRFIQRWLASQTRDLEVLMGAAGRDRGAGAAATTMTTTAMAAAGGAGGAPVPAAYPGPGPVGTDGWRRGGDGSVWASDEVRESVALWAASRGYA
ncbi:MAG: SWI/SNF complex component snf12 [Phylliscum demangeonii]|nr:MAG: SWI/SNF complex component snf12 [Phylliscum demangeonii]